MIIMDLSQVLLATMMVQIGNHRNAEITEDMFRHMAINSIRANKVKFQDEFGELVIAADSKQYWRRSAFPYYKAGRREGREASELDWEAIFRMMANVTAEIKTFLPYKVVHVEGAEADDIIGTACHTYGKYLGTSDPILVLSGDKDFVQLHKYTNIKQFAPAQKKWVRIDDADAFLKDHIIQGDKGDGIPNVLSDDDTFMLGKRQTTLSQKRKNTLRSSITVNEDGTVTVDESDPLITGQVSRNIHRNSMLVDLRRTPEKVKSQIISELEAENEKDRSQLLAYFSEKGLRNLVEFVGDF